ncbi:hypothetical protein OAK30_04825 [Candidatus Nitrosopelagicus sp.]|nr:hypothetical protein [Candidatus Nitrosopelagicus sp.]
MSIIGIFSRSKQMITENKTPTELCIECESIIQDEKKEYGRVSKITMRMLREKYGDDRANRAMYRQQKKKNIKSSTESMIEKGIDIVSALVTKKTSSL